MAMEGEGQEGVLLKKIEELEAGQAKLKQEIMARLSLSVQLSPPKDKDKDDVVARLPPHSTGRVLRSQSLSPRRPPPPLLSGSGGGGGGGGGGRRALPLGLSERHFLRVLQSMGQSLHILDLQRRIIYWNHSAEILYGYTASEALGNDALNLLFDPHNYEIATQIFHRVTTAGDSWAGKLPVKNKSGDHFLAISTNTPFYDDDGSLVGMVCVSSDPRLFDEVAPGAGGESCSKAQDNRGIGIGRWSEAGSTPLQAAIASKLSTLVSVHINTRDEWRSTQLVGY